MKKFACIALAAALCVGACALAESVPSKTTADMTQIEVVVENLPANVPAPVVAAVTAQMAVEENAAPKYQETVKACETAIAELSQKLNSGASVASFFGEVKNAEGETVKLEEVLGTTTLNVNEFIPLVVSNYDPSYGAMTTSMTFATPYKKGQPVVMLVGIVTVNADGTQSIEWVSFEGVGTEAGGVDVTLTPEILMAIQEGTAMMAVVSE